MGDKYRIKHELISQQKLRSVQGLITKRQINTTYGPQGKGLQTHQVQLWVCLWSMGRAWGRVCAHPGRAAGPSGTDWNAFSCCPHHLQPYRSKNHLSLVHDFERL